MDFDSLLEIILILVDFVKPVGSLVSSFFQGLFSNIVAIHALFFVAVSFFLLKVFIDIFTDLTSM